MSLPYRTLPQPHHPALPYPTDPVTLPALHGIHSFKVVSAWLSIKFQSFGVWCWGLWPVAYVPTLPDLAYPRPTLP